MCPKTTKVAFLSKYTRAMMELKIKLKTQHIRIWHKTNEVKALNATLEMHTNKWNTYNWRLNDQANPFWIWKIFICPRPNPISEQ